MEGSCTNYFLSESNLAEELVIVVVDSSRVFLRKQNESVQCTRKCSYQNNTCEVTAEAQYSYQNRQTDLWLKFQSLYTSGKAYINLVLQATLSEAKSPPTPIPHRFCTPLYYLQTQTNVSAEVKIQIEDSCRAP